MTRHDPTVSLLVALFLTLVVHSGPSAPILTATNSTSVPEGWLQSPAHELVLDLQQQVLEFGARRDASEFMQSVINVLLRANYSVRFSDEFIQAEIRYYRDNAAREQLELSQAIQKCLSAARASGNLDWECFKGDLTRTGDPTAAARHLPWLAPPFKANLLSLAGVGVTNVPCLHLSLKWSGRPYRGTVQHTRRPGGLAGETVLTEGDASLWAFAAVMRLTQGDQTLFEKEYPREDWQASYATIYEQPLWRTSEAILRDLVVGLKPKPSVPANTDKKKSRKRSEATPDRVHSP